MPTVSYPLDTSGVSPANLVRDELHTVSEGQFRDYHFLVPDLAPFFVDNFSMKISVNGVDTILHEDVDYSFAIPYVTGTRTTGKQMYGAITLHNLNANGLLKVNYQTIGGDQVVDRLHVLTVLAEKVYNPRTVIFDILTNVPNAFPPVPHYQDYSSFFGQEEVVTALNEIAAAIANNSSLNNTQLNSFLSEFNSGNSNTYLNKTGGAMTGALTLSGAPTQPNHAVTKTYVDNLVMNNESITSLLSSYATSAALNEAVDLLLPKTGGTLTGPLTVQVPTEIGHAVNLGAMQAALAPMQSSIDAMATAIGTSNGGFVTVDDFNNVINEIRVYINHIKP